MNNKKLLGLVILVFIIITTVIIFSVSYSEKYRVLKDVGKFPINLLFNKPVKNDESIHKYSGIRYKHKRRFNFLNRQNIRGVN
jgi:hypothetical protein